jgi:hypothetical protein
MYLGLLAQYPRGPLVTRRQLPGDKGSVCEVELAGRGASDAGDTSSLAPIRLGETPTPVCPFMFVTCGTTVRPGVWASRR